MKLMDQVDHLIQSQLNDWPQANENYTHLKGVHHRVLPLNEYKVVLQYNPNRIRSAAAAIDVQSLAQRPCFLCKEHRSPLQQAILFEDKYEIMVNPFPIFEHHLTLSSVEHTPQRVHSRLLDMLEIVKALPSFTLFYNGPRAGASAPDHMHFQAVEKGKMPLEMAFEEGEIITQLTHLVRSASIYRTLDCPVSCLMVQGREPLDLQLAFNKIYEQANLLEPSLAEPNMNLLVNFDPESGYYTLWIMLRKAHRPWQYSATGKEQLLISPASVEMGGLFALAREEDYNKLTALDLRNIYEQTLFSNSDLEHLLTQLS